MCITAFKLRDFQSGCFSHAYNMDIHGDPSLNPVCARQRVCFMQVFLTQSHLGIVMEYAAGGELFDRIVKAGRFSEDEARFFFQQLISGVGYCHGEVSPAASSRHGIVSLHDWHLPDLLEAKCTRTCSPVHTGPCKFIACHWLWPLHFACFDVRKLP